MNGYIWLLESYNGKEMEPLSADRHNWRSDLFDCFSDDDLFDYEVILCSY